MAKPYLSLEAVGKSFSRGAASTEVLKDIDLKVERGEFISIIGHSGCGKSTLLNIVAGLTKATTGAVLLDNQEVNEPGPDRAVVFQNHSLLPWLTVYENVRLAVDKVFRERPVPRRSGTTGRCTISTSSRWRMPRTKDRPKSPAA